MNTKQFGLIFYLLCILTNISNSQVRQNGLVLPENTGDHEICCIYTPKDGFKVFDKPNGKEIGVLTRNINTIEETYYKIYFVDETTKNFIQIDIKNFQEVGYEVFSVKYFERKDGFIRIIDQSVNYWLSEKEINNKNFKVLDWQEFLIEKSGRFLGFYAKDPGLNLRTNPTTNSEILKKLEGNLFQIIPTQESNGLWTKVNVKKYIKHPCAEKFNESENLEYELKGWIKIIDEKGKPNVWYYARGC